MRKWMLLISAIVTLMFAPVKKADITTYQPKERFEPRVSAVERYELERYFLEHPAPSLIEIQYRLLDPKARASNGVRLCQETQEFNKAADKWSAEFSTYRTVYDIKPEILLPFLQEMKDRLDKVEAILNRYDEVSP